MASKHIHDPVDRACSAISALKGFESLIGQIGQAEINGDEISMLLRGIIENLNDAVEDMHQQIRQIP